MAYSFEHSVDCAVPRDFAWAFWTDPRNWAIDADVESYEIEGPFAAGTAGHTVSKRSGRTEWRIAEVEAWRAVIEFPLEDAVARFTWTFAENGAGVRMTQRFTLEGVKAAGYAAAFGPAMEANIPAGMATLCAATTNARR